MDDRFGRRQIDPDEELRLAREAMQRTIRRVQRLAPLVLGVLLLGWIASGIYTVQAGEVGVVRTFGAFTATTNPGLNYHLPFPIQHADVVNVLEIRRVEVGFRTQEGRAARVAHEALMLTGDENIVDAQVVIQYRVADPVPYLFMLRDPDEAVRASAEVALRGVTGRHRIDDLMTVRRGEAQQETHEELQRLMDLYRSGILITTVQLQVVDVPDEVKDAFHEVVRAFQDRERLQNEAQAYAADIVPRARGEAQQMILSAQGYREQRVLEAQGDGARFEMLWEEYDRARDVTRERLRLETLEEVLADVDKIVIDGPASNGVLPFLQLRGDAPPPITTNPGQQQAPGGQTPGQ